VPDFNLTRSIREPVNRPHFSNAVWVGSNLPPTPPEESDWENWGDGGEHESRDYTIIPNGKYLPNSDLPLIVASMVLDVLYKKDGVPLLRGMYVKDEKVILYKWNGHVYELINIPTIKKEIQTFLTRECVVAKRKPPKSDNDFDNDEVYYDPFPAKDPTVNNVYKAIIRDVLTHKASDKEVIWLGDDEPPADPANLIFAKNCVIDVKRGCIIPNSPNWFNVTTLSCNYAPKTKQKPTIYLKYEDRLTGGDKKKIMLLRQFSGLSLIDNASLQKALLIIGPPNSGKSQQGILLSDILTKPNMFSLDGDDFAKNFGLEEAIGKKLALLSDCRFTTAKTIKTAVEKILKLVAADPLPIKRKYKAADTLRLHTRVLMITNDVPVLPDRTGALRRRFSVLNVPDSAVLQRHEIDLDLTKKMLQNESEAILNLWVEAVIELMQMPNPELCKPDDEDVILDQMSQFSNHCHLFLSDCCEKIDGVELDADTAFGAYVQWCESTGEEPESRSGFIALMEGCNIRTLRRNYDIEGRPHNNFTRFVGIALKPE